MNYLAHTFLSGKNEGILMGNIMGDFVRNKDIEGRREQVIAGVELHRNIDYFTDRHSSVKECVSIVKETQGRYAPVIVDIYFDFFLANSWESYAVDGLKDHTQWVYDVLSYNMKVLPTKLQESLPYLIKRNWLFNYQYLWGVERALNDVSRRASSGKDIPKAVYTLRDQRDELKEKFDEFFPDLLDYVKTELKGVEGAISNYK